MVGLRILAGFAIVGAVALILTILFAVSIFGWDDEARVAVFGAGLVIAVAIGVLVLAYKPGASHKGILVDESAYTDATPQRADIIVFDDPRTFVADEDALFLKRVIALGGEVIEIRDNQVWIDGVVLAEPYVKPGSAMPDMEPLLIPDGFLFVMGDNRSRSQDSRVFGPIPDSLLVGKVVEIVNP